MHFDDLDHVPPETVAVIASCREDALTIEHDGDGRALALQLHFSGPDALPPFGRG